MGILYTAYHTVSIHRSRLDRAAGLAEAARVRERRRVHRLRDALAEDHVALRVRVTDWLRNDVTATAGMECTALRRDLEPRRARHAAPAPIPKETSEGATFAFGWSKSGMSSFRTRSGYGVGASKNDPQSMKPMRPPARPPNSAASLRACGYTQQPA